METIYLEKFLENGIIKEEAFRENVAKYNWNTLNGKKVLMYQ